MAADNFQKVGVKAVVENIAGYLRDIDKMEARTKASMNKIGKGMVIVGLAAGVVLGATAKMAAGFEASMNKIVTLVGVSRDQVNQWSDALLELGPKLGKGPQELAEALFVITSAGVRGAKSLEILESAAKASAAGLGETKEIARAVTAAIQAYGEENLSAAQATDILVATVREGNLEASSLAGSLGRVIGIAAEVGVGFADLNAFIATFTRLGVSAEESVTALRGTLNIMLNPTREAEEALGGLRLTFADLTTMIGEEGGLVNVLGTLVNAFEGNAQGLAQIVPNVRALSGVLGVAGQQLDVFGEITRKINDSLGITNEAFEGTAQTAAFQFAQLKATFEAVAIDIGTDLLPVIIDFMGVLTDLIALWGSIPDSAQTVIVMLAALTTAIFLIGGAAIFVVPQIIAFNAALTTLGLSTGVLAGAALPALGVALAAAAVGLGVAAIASDEFGQSMIDMFPVITALQLELAKIPLIGRLPGPSDAVSRQQASEVAETYARVFTAAFTRIQEEAAKTFRLIAEEGRKSGADIGEIVSAQATTAVEKLIELNNELAELETAYADASLEERAAATAALLAEIDAWNKVFDSLVLNTDQIAALEKAYKDLTLAGIEPGVIDALAFLVPGLEAAKVAAEGAGEATAEFGDGLGDLEEDIEETVDVLKEYQSAVERSSGGVISAIESILPAVDETFEQWQERLREQAAAYVEFEQNLGFILNALTEAHVKQPGRIIAALQNAGPEVTQAMAVFLARNGVEAVMAELGLLDDVAALSLDEMRLSVLNKTPEFVEAMQALIAAGVDQSLITAALGGAALGGVVVDSFVKEIGRRGREQLAGGVAPVSTVDFDAIRQQLLDRPIPGVSGVGGGAGAGVRTKTPEDLIVDAARAASTIANAIQKSMDVFNNLAGFEGNVDFDALTRLKDVIVQAVTIFGEGVNEASLRAIEDAAAWAGNAGRIVGLISSGVDAFEQLADFGGVAREDVMAFVDDYVFVAEQFAGTIPRESSNVTSAASAWASNANAVVGLIGSGVGSLMELDAFSRINRQLFAGFVDDYVFVAEGFSSRIPVASKNVTEAAETWSKRAAAVVGLIGSGIGDLGALTDFSRISRMTFAGFVDDFLFAAEGFSSRIPAASGDVTQAASDWAKMAASVVGVIGSGVTNLLALDDFAPISRGALTRFIGDFIFVAEEFGRRIPVANTTLTQAAADWAGTARSLVETISAGVQGFLALDDFIGPTELILTNFIDALVLAVTLFSERVVDMDREFAEQGEIIAGSAAGILDAITRAVTLFSDGIPFVLDYSAALDTLIDLMVFAVQSFTSKVNLMDKETAAVASQLAGTASNLIGGIVKLMEFLQMGKLISNRAVAQADDIGDLLVDLIARFANRISVFEDETAEVTSTMAAAVADLVGAFVALQGDLSRVNTSPIFRFIGDLIAGFNDVIEATRNLRNNGAQAEMDFLAGLVGFITNLLAQFGIKFNVPSGEPSAPPSEPPTPPGEPPPLVIPREPLLPDEIKEVVDAIIAGLLQAVTQLDIPEDELDLLERKADVFATLARAFRDMVGAVDKAADLETAPFFTFLNSLLLGLSDFLDEAAALGGDLTGLGMIFQAMAALVDNINNIQLVGATDPSLIESAGKNIGNFILQMLEVLSEGLEGFDLSALADLGSVLSAIADFLDSLTGVVGSAVAPAAGGGAPAFHQGTMYAPGGPASLLPGEIVIPPALSEAMRQSISAPMLMGSGGGTVTIDNFILQFGKDVDQDMVRAGVAGGISDLQREGLSVTLRGQGLIA